MSTFNRVTCQSCARIIQASPKNEHGQPQPNQTHEVGALAEVSMGHAMMFTKTGRTALCICNKKAA